MKQGIARAVLITALLSTASVASAADVVIPEEPAPVVTPIFTWTGFYVGIVGGYNWGKADWTIEDTGDFARFDAKGGFIGGTLGYNYQFYNNVVLGLETDLSWSGAKGDIPCPNPDFTCETKNRWIGTLRPRVGYAFDRFLPYITGGAAYGNVRLSADNPTTGESFSDSNTRFGWTAGAGVEYAFTDNLTAKVEYLHIDLGKDDYNIGGDTVRGKWRSDGVRVGLNYKF
ncbi:outer membrane immunogenic protein [Pseudaminobacter salicylatoxidans]|uniref:Outer membrane immunogenic protein n=1 Tax=Pseudaminobacter salicylatoxidans TaxID=93369 RepID=A0A316C081_PSESE|nr:outer membrane protein [Pseudaminobacter salicylatoxidans]PWJ79811.1 outer membrane immunogenic protein [Pseudaminobacter salicylatoxidans]